MSTSVAVDVELTTSEQMRDALYEEHPAWVEETEFDHDAYTSSLSNRAKQGWVVFQGLMMTIYMIIGIKSYNKVIPGWCKQKTLLVMQTAIIAYLIVNEFNDRHISGLFLILLFTQWSLFATFNIVVDSMLTTEQHEKINDSRLRTFNKVFRVTMHGITIALFISTFWMKDCHESIYPRNFLAIVSIILIHQAYDVYLCCNKYMIDWDNLPFESSNRMMFNKKLFEKQSKALMYGNIVFGVISILTVAAGYFIMNKQSVPGSNQHLLCVNGYEWIYLSPVGNIFGTLHQLLVLMQINITQYVLVKIPRNEGLFKDDDEKDYEHKQHLIASSLRVKLLQTGESTVADEKPADGSEPKLSLGKLLAKIKESQRQGDDDNFRA